MYHKINRNNTAIIDEVNSSPLYINNAEILGNQNRLRHDIAAEADIIELDDSDVSSTFEETPIDNLNHAWCYINNSKDLQDNYRINKQARERRRLRNDDRRSTFSPCEYIHNNNNVSDSCDISANDYKNNVRLKHQINCFTIINKHFNNSDTSSENTEYDNKELVRPMGDTCKDNDLNNIFGDETLTYNNDCDAEKKTIWIYSFKNKRLLSDNYIEMINIPSSESESCTSYSLEKFEEDSENISRVASPIPPPYIPRLNLSLGQTLSTVTEVTEPNKHPSSVETDRLSKLPVIQKPNNSWINNYNDRNNQEKSTNIVNWMALSPRQRKRIFRARASNATVKKGKLATLQDTCLCSETKVHIGQHKDDEDETYNDINSRTIDVDVHVIPKLVTLEVGSKDSENCRADNDHIDGHDDENAIGVITDDDNMEFIKCSRKPQIKISQKCIINTKSITDPIEKLNTDNWIVEDSEEVTATYSYDLERPVENNFNKGDSALTANDRLWSKNARALMKPAQWNEYAPIAESHLSLHLSLGSTIDKQSWLSRLISLFKCCK